MGQQSGRRHCGRDGRPLQAERSDDWRIEGKESLLDEPQDGDGGKELRD